MEIIIPHTNTDLDALGAAIGAQVLYPHAVIVLPGTPGPLAQEFISLHRYHVRVRTAREVDLSAVTRVIVVDTADPSRLGVLQETALRSEVHLYDHHPPEPDDLKGALEVRELVGATCTLIAERIEAAGAPLTPVQATALLAGIYADTGSLSHAGTTARDARAAAFLLDRGANLRAVGRFTQVTLSPAQQALLRQMQNRTRWVLVRGARIRIVEAETPEYIGGLSLVVHRLWEILPAHALFAAVKMADRVHLVGRSEVPWVDSARVMAAFGGGGHPGAAAAVIKGAEAAEAGAKLETVLSAVVERPLVARDVMSAPVKTIAAAKPVREAGRLMLRYGHSGLPVVDDAGRLEGMVSLRDVEKAQRHGLEHAPVKGMMVRRVVTVPPDLPLDEVQDLMVAKDIGRVPVVADGNLVGIITRSDLLGELYGSDPPHWHQTLYAGPLPGIGDLSDNVVERAMAAASPAVAALLRHAGIVADSMGIRAYAVGGFVRDLLLGRPNLDIDIVAEGDGLAYARALGAVLGGSVKEVPRFGTAHIYLQAGHPDLPARVDVATARREFYSHAAALPVVEFADLREDLYRRDFSMNALAVPLGPEGPTGLIDFFGGLADLEAGHIRILHTLSFVEDPTRLLRAIRFAHRYGFTLEAETAKLARSAVAGGYLDRVSMERLRHELVLILQEPHSGGALAMLAELELLRRILPGTDMTEAVCGLIDRVDQQEEVLPEVYIASATWLTKLMLLVYQLPLPAATKLVRSLKLRREEAQKVAHALACWQMALEVLTSPRATPAEVVRILQGWAPEGLLMLHLLGGGDMVARYWREWRHVRLEITGADLVAAGVKEGPAIRRALARVLAERLDGSVPDRDSQLALALRLAGEED